ncbi:hypothetical protein PLESTM_000448400, partial [Pleodorina starrii]
AAGLRAEAEMDERVAQRLEVLLQEQPSVFELLAPPETLRRTTIEYLRAGGGEDSAAKKQLRVYHLRHRLEQLGGWGVIGPKRQVAQLAVVQQVSSAWPYLMKGATLDEQGQLVDGGFDGEDEVNRSLGLLSPRDMQLWLLGRWRSMSPDGRRLDRAVLRWRLKRLLERGLVSEQVFDAQRDALGVVSVRYTQIVEEGMSLELANKMARRHGRKGAGRPRGSGSAQKRAASSEPFAWLRQPRRSRSEAAAEREEAAAAAAQPKVIRSRGRPAGRPAARTWVRSGLDPDSGTEDEELEAAYQSMLDSDPGNLDPDLRSLILSTRRRARHGGAGGAGGAAAGTGQLDGVTGIRQPWWLSRASMPDATTAAGAREGGAIDVEASAVPPAAAAELPGELLAKVLRLQQLVRQQRDNLTLLEQRQQQLHHHHHHHQQQQAGLEARVAAGEADAEAVRQLLAARSVLSQVGGDRAGQGGTGWDRAAGTAQCGWMGG